jgi:hypothetical protein
VVYWSTHYDTIGYFFTLGQIAGHEILKCKYRAFSVIAAPYPNTLTKAATHCSLFRSPYLERITRSPQHLLQHTSPFILPAHTDSTQLLTPRSCLPSASRNSTSHPARSKHLLIDCIIIVKRATPYRLSGLHQHSIPHLANVSCVRLLAGSLFQ